MGFTVNMFIPTALLGLVPTAVLGAATVFYPDYFGTPIPLSA
jgi:hypothetical protein